MADGKDDKTPPLGGGAGDDADALAGFDLSSLQESLGAMTGGMPGGAGGPDMSALGDLLGGMGGAVSAPAAGGAGGGRGSRRDALVLRMLVQLEDRLPSASRLGDGS